MIRSRLASAILTITLLASMPASVTAQDPAPGPEGMGWALVTYLVDEEPMTVPFDVDATLRLGEGKASGSGGCNAFSGSYELDGEMLTFSEEMTRTLKLCGDEVQAVEDTYLASLPEVQSWAVIDDVLELSDGAGEVILTFERPHIMWTSSELAGLMATLTEMQDEIAALREDIDGMGVARLRQRIKALETESSKLKQQVEGLRKTAKPTPKPVAFSAAESVLLEAIPPRIASGCKPLRSRLPAGTVAAVQCEPNTAIVSEMAYYLLGKSAAIALFEDRMDAQGVEAIGELPPPGTKGCWDGKASYSGAPGGYVGAVGCYVAGGKANLRLLDEATNCKQLEVGDRTLRRPVVYAAIEGPDRKIKPLYDWSMKNKPNDRFTGIVKPIARPSAQDSPNCPGI